MTGAGRLSLCWKFQPVVGLRCGIKAAPDSLAHATAWRFQAR